MQVLSLIHISEMLEPKEFKFEDSNYYYAALKDTIEELQTGRPGKKRRQEPKHFSKRKEAKHDYDHQNHVQAGKGTLHLSLIHISPSASGGR